VKVALYIEGGGSSRSLHIECRKAFRELLERAGFGSRMPGTRACGSRNEAFADFRTALSIAGSDEYPILLVDSEGPVSQPAWSHLKSRDGWDRPAGADDDQAQLMVQCMETWCVADRMALRSFFHQCLTENSLPPLDGIENRAKPDVQDALSHATHQCGRNRRYQKGSRSFDLVAQLDPIELKKYLPHFARLCDVLDRKL
jgi:hypothetical protein